MHPRSSYAARTRSATLVVALLLGLCATACGSSSGGSSGGSSASTSPKTIDITLKGDSVSPHGTLVQVQRNQKVDLHIMADKAGELHVHSSPEQHIEFGAGMTHKTLRFDKPGVIEIEDHALYKLVVKLQVR